MIPPPLVMDAISRGVEARYEELFHLAEIVTGETADIARQFGIAETEIGRWVANRQHLVTERRTVLESLLTKLERSPIAQKLLMVDEPNQPALSPDWSN